jgi:glycine cleavage system H protein
VFEKDGVATIGLCAFPVGLGVIVRVELLGLGTKVKRLDKIGELESGKAVCDALSPLSGEIIEVNAAVLKKPKLITDDPFGDGWLIKLKAADLSELDHLMSFKEYQESAFARQHHWRTRGGSTATRNTRRQQEPRWRMR